MVHLRYLHISASLSPHYRSFLLQEIRINTEIHIWTVCREWETLKHSALNETPMSDPAPEAQGTPVETCGTSMRTGVGRGAV